VAAESSLENLSELELRFSRSRRRAAARRRIPPKRGLLASRSFRAAVLTLALLALVAESIGVETSKAKPRPLAAKRLVPALGASCPVPGRFRTAFARAAAETKVPASLLVATAYVESRMDPTAHSQAGAEGLLQLMPQTAREVRLAGDDPAVNVLAGARYLRQMLDRFGSVDLALAAYNAGPTAVERAGGAPTFATLQYVKNVEARAASLLSC
jgi:soluble lytic murein transglycosylase-like protein